MTKFRLSMIGMLGVLMATGCSDANHLSGIVPVDTDTGYIPDSDDKSVDTGFDTDPTDIPYIDFSMPCLDYKLLSYYTWLGNGGEALAINNDDLAVGRLQNLAMGASANVQHMPFIFEPFEGYSQRHWGNIFSGFYYYSEGLPELELRNVYPVDVNSSGMMAAQGNHEEDTFVHAGYMDSIGIFQRLFDGETESVPEAINDSGQIVGYFYNSYYDYSSGAPVLVEEFQGFLWHDDVTPPTFLNPLPGAPTDASVSPLDLSNAGLVVGGAVDAAGLWQAFTWDEIDGYTVLSPLAGGEAIAHGTNDFGVVVGESSDSAGTWKPVVWDETGAITDLGLLTTLPMHSGVALAVNNSGTVVGTDDPVSALAPSRAWVWKDGVKSDLTATHNPHNYHQFANAYDINDNGVIVGRNLVYGSGPFAYALFPQDCGAGSEN